MRIRGLDEFSKSSPEAKQIVELIIIEFTGNMGEANKYWFIAVKKCLWTDEIWGDLAQAERAAASLILRVKYTEDELKRAGIDLTK